MSTRLMLTEVAKLLRDYAGLTGDTLVRLVAASVVESGPGRTANPNGLLFADWREENPDDADPPKWGPSINFLQVRSLQPGRPELEQGYAHRDQAFLRASPINGAIAVGKVLQEPGASLDLWSSISSGDYLPFMPAATAAVSAMANTGVAPSGAEIPAQAPPTPAVTAPPTASLVAGMGVYGPQDIVIEGRSLKAFAEIVTASINRRIDDAPTLTIRTVDTDGKLLASGILEEAARSTIDGLLFELTGSASSRKDITLVMVDAAAAELMRDIPEEVISQAPDTGSRGDFLTRLIKRHAWIPIDIETGADQRVELATRLGESIWQATGRIAAEVGWRRTAVANRILIGSDRWLGNRTAPLHIREGVGGVDRIEFDYAPGTTVARARVTCDATLWSAPPTQAVSIGGKGPANGSWLVAGISKASLAATQATVELTRIQRPLPEPVPSTPDDPEYSDPVEAESGGPIVPGATSSGGWQWPMTGRISSGFGPRTSPGGGVGSTNHAGIDIAAGRGTPIYAAKAGTVTVAGTAGGYGTAVYIDHGGGLFSRYGHMQRTTVTRGQKVEQGQQIGLCNSTGNSTGNHLHFEIRPGDRPVDPLPLLPAR